MGPPSFRRRHHSLFSIFFKFNGDDDFFVVGQANKFVSTTSLERKMSVSIAFLLHFLDKKELFCTSTLRRLRHLALNELRKLQWRLTNKVE